MQTTVSKKFTFNFWIANLIEVLERFAYYGMYIPFKIYAEDKLGLTPIEIGAIQTAFLALSYLVPLISGTLADRYGFKKMLIISFLVYLPGFLLLMVVEGFLPVMLVMTLIAIAAGLFKPLIAGTVRLETNPSNRTLGFGIFYLMVNIGAFFGPITAGHLRLQSWTSAFWASVIAVLAMLVIAIVFYREPKREEAVETQSLSSSFKILLQELLKPRMLLLILFFGLLVEIPFWTFFNLYPSFADKYVDTPRLYDGVLAFFSSIGLKSVGESILAWISRDEIVAKVSLGALISGHSTPALANSSFMTFFNDIGLSTVGEKVVGAISLAVTSGEHIHRIAGETLSHTAGYIILFQMLVTKVTEKGRSIPVMVGGILTMLIGYLILFFSKLDPWLMFAGILIFAIGEMAAMPRFEMYLITLLPEEYTGIASGMLRVVVAVGALSGIIMNPIYADFEKLGAPEYTWIVNAGVLFAGAIAMIVYDKFYRREV